MPRIGNDFGIEFYVYAKDHNPPHIHAIYGSDEAMLVIATGAVLRGSLPGSKLAKAVAWLNANQAHAQAEWDRMNP